MSVTEKFSCSSLFKKRNLISKIKSIPNNNVCFDCSSKNPEYISINNGIFICNKCLEIHNKFRKEISNTINNLTSLNMTELKYLYLGGNQKLYEFINYEYSNLKNFKTEILYQTNAMQYYRNNLNYQVNGGVKPKKPNSNINAYELINTNNIHKYEKVKINDCDESNLIKNKYEHININDKSRNINKKKNSPKVSIKNSFSSLDTSHLKKHKSFYKEMNKIFSKTINLDDSIYKKQKIKRIHSNMRTCPKSVEIQNDSEENIDKFYNSSNNFRKEVDDHHINNIYNNNFFTLSATKNIFMFTPHKDSIIYKHRKITNSQKKNYNKNEIYLKPKINILLNSEEKKENSQKKFPINTETNNDNYSYKTFYQNNRTKRIFDNLNLNKTDNYYLKLSNNKIDEANESDNENEIPQKKMGISTRKPFYTKIMTANHTINYDWLPRQMEDENNKPERNPIRIRNMLFYQSKKRENKNDKNNFNIKIEEGQNNNNNNLKEEGLKNNKFKMFKLYSMKNGNNINSNALKDFNKLSDFFETKLKDSNGERNKMKERYKKIDNINFGSGIENKIIPINLDKIGKYNLQKTNNPKNIITKTITNINDDEFKIKKIDIQRNSIRNLYKKKNQL